MSRHESPNPPSTTLTFGQSVVVFAAISSAVLMWLSGSIFALIMLAEKFSFAMLMIMVGIVVACLVGIVQGKKSIRDQNAWAAAFWLNVPMMLLLLLASFFSITYE